MIHLEQLEKAYVVGNSGKIEVLRGIQMEFEEGDTISVCGKSGSGKSTLLNLIAGLDRPSGGDILWREESILKWSSSRIAKWRRDELGMVFQAYHLLPDLSAIENVMFPSWLGRKEVTKRAEELLEQVGLKDRMGHRPHQLSGGEQQRVAIARALINDPKLVLADEPTGNLDQETGAEVIQILLDLVKEREKALLLVTHDDGVAKLAEKRLALDRGQFREKSS